MKKSKIAILSENYQSWGGGVDFLIDLIKVIDYKQDKYNVCVFIPKENFLNFLIRKLFGKKTIKKQYSNLINSLKLQCSDVPLYFYKKSIFDKNGIGIKKCGFKNNIDLLLAINGVFSKLKNNKFKTVSYIYDFQHKYYPDYFTAEEIENRDYFFEKSLSLYDYSFVQSNDTKNDVKKFYPKFFDKVIVLKDYPHISNLVLNDIDSVLKKYGINNKFFIISNQFWKHKSYDTAFKAMEIVFNKGFDNIDLICTGNTKDYRFPNYFNELKEMISKMNCKNNIKILGYIDKNDQLTLLKNSIAVIQPTLFEGNPGGGSAVDASAYGVPIIASDIPINLEIAECFEKKFFKAKDENDLANIIIEYILNYNPSKMRIPIHNFDEFYEDYDKTLSFVLGKD